MRHIKRHAVVFLLGLFVAGPVLAQQIFIYPSKGQNEKQMEKDKFECHVWAKKQSGFDPLNPPSLQELEAKVRSQQQARQDEGSEVGESVVKGIVGGAIIGEVVKDEPGKGAVIGGVVGGIHGAQKAEKRKEAQQQAIKRQAQAELARLRNDYKRAYAACLEGRGYTVK
jgi:hypothetical protein